METQDFIIIIKDIPKKLVQDIVSGMVDLVKRRGGTLDISTDIIELDFVDSLSVEPNALIDCITQATGMYAATNEKKGHPAKLSSINGKKKTFDA